MSRLEHLSKTRLKLIFRSANGNSASTSERKKTRLQNLEPGSKNFEPYSKNFEPYSKNFDHMQAYVQGSGGGARAIGLTLRRREGAAGMTALS